MNPVTFNDKFKDCVISTEGKVKWEREIKNAPLVYYQFSIDDVKDKLTGFKEKMDNDEAAHPFPFPVFRGEFHPRDPEEKGKSHLAYFSIIVVSNPEYTEGRVYVKPSNLLNDKHIPVLAFPIVTNFTRGVISGYLKGKWKQLDRIERYTTLKDGTEVDTEDCSREIYECTLKSVFCFCSDAMVPSNHMVEVKPVRDEAKRSIEWQRARTHYTLITHGHPANNRNVQHGQSVPDDCKGEITRMAHNRRAHYRLLRSDRFRFAKGQRVFVRSTWVGPKEWKDEGGKQIYKILEPVI